MLPVICLSQDPDDKILMTIDGKDISSGEFIRMYKKGFEPGKKIDIDSYLQQYIIFKLKVADAVHEGYDTTRAFRNELKGYRDQLAQSYLTDSQVKEKLLRKEYERSLIEINAWHILISSPQNSSPHDTLNAWTKALEVRNLIIKGEPFEKVARSVSDDKSVKINGGNLGYFTALQMVMPFEDAVYSLSEDSISMPVRTPFGYHIIKVTDKRPSKGKIKVAHIMKSVPPGTNEKEAIKAEEEINDIYKKLQEGTPFSDLAKRYSDHKESASKGGELGWFGTGEILSTFSEAAFSITDTGNYTKPIRTFYGWHIIKLLDRKAQGSYEESKSFLENRINQSYLNSISKKSFTGKLKQEYNFKINTDVHKWFVKNTDTLIMKGTKKYNRSNMPKGNIYSFADQCLTTKQFADYIEGKELIIPANDPLFFVNRSIEAKSAEQLITYENSLLESKYPEFRYLITEFHDGILLFEISGKKIWNTVNKDTLGLQRYYEDHKYNYLSPQAIDAKIYTIRSAKGGKKLLSAYKKYSQKPDLDNHLIEKFNKKDTLLIIEKNTWFKGDDQEIDTLKWTEGVHFFTKNGFPSIIIVNKVIDPVPLKFDKVQEEMVTGYQEYLENNWIKQLKEKYSVKINSSVFDEVKNILKNE